MDYIIHKKYPYFIFQNKFFWKGMEFILENEGKEDIYDRVI